MDKEGKVPTPERYAANSVSLRLACLWRDQFAQRMQSTARNLTHLDTASVHLIQSKIALLARQFSTFESLQSKVELLDESQFDDDYWGAFKPAYCEFKAIIKERMLESIKSSSQSKDLQSSSSHPSLSAPRSSLKHTTTKDIQLQ